MMREVFECDVCGTDVSPDNPYHDRYILTTQPAPPKGHPDPRAGLKTSDLCYSCYRAIGGFVEKLQAEHEAKREADG